MRWNPLHNAHLGSKVLAPVQRWPLLRGLCTQTVHLGPECLANILQLTFLQGWPLRARANNKLWLSSLNLFSSDLNSHVVLRVLCFSPSFTISQQLLKPSNTLTSLNHLTPSPSLNYLTPPLSKLPNPLPSLNHLTPPPLSKLLNPSPL